ncbi:hypothetical protein K438DRAFT_1993785 [Mycena galopus ATCC 62051]|nr:hypothetical protein K438DRAFT_1993785 [Mycena galopus ATCC 62051]
MHTPSPLDHLALSQLTASISHRHSFAIISSFRLHQLAPLKGEAPDHGPQRSSNVSFGKVSTTSWPTTYSTIRSRLIIHPTTVRTASMRVLSGRAREADRDISDSVTDLS